MYKRHVRGRDSSVSSDDEIVSLNIYASSCEHLTPVIIISAEI